MAIVDTPPPIGHRAMIERAKNILVNPPHEWEVIDAEPATVRGIYLNYLVYIAAIGPVCRFVGNVVFNHLAVIPAAIIGVIGYLIELGVVYLVAWLIDLLAPQFGGQANRVQAMKVAAYSFTAPAAAGVFGLVPALSALEIVGFYGLVLMWIGLPRLMRIPEEKRLSDFGATVACMLVGGALLMFMFSFVPSIGRV
jgi:hypothetical protein